MMQSFARSLSSSKFCSRGKIYAPLSNNKELKKLIDYRSWNVSEAIPDPNTIEEEITPELVQKLLKQSGISHNLSQQAFKKLEDSLRTQVGFIDELYEPGMSHGERCANNSSLFRVLASDHQPTEPLTLKDLLAEVEQVKKQVDPEKGEQGFNHEVFRNTIKFGI